MQTHSCITTSLPNPSLVSGEQGSRGRVSWSNVLCFPAVFLVPCCFGGTYGGGGCLSNVIGTGMAVIGGSGPSLCVIPSRVCERPGRSFAVCSGRWSSPVCHTVIYSARSATGGRELYRGGQKAAQSLQLHLPRASSGSSGEGGAGDEGDQEGTDGNSDDEEGQSDAVEAEEEGAADRGPRDDDKEGGGFWGSIWRRKTRNPDPEEKLEESDSAASGRIEEEEIVEPPSAERRRGWRFPWNWDADREESEQEAREEEAEEQRRKREGIFVFDVDKESLELRWQDLLDPTVENVLALILTGCLVLAIVQILWQLFIVAAAITVSAIKYTVLAIFLIGILVFLV